MVHVVDDQVDGTARRPRLVQQRDIEVGRRGDDELVGLRIAGTDNSVVGDAARHGAENLVLVIDVPVAAVELQRIAPRLNWYSRTGCPSASELSRLLKLIVTNPFERQGGSCDALAIGDVLNLDHVAGGATERHETDARYIGRLDQAAQGGIDSHALGVGVQLGALMMQR
ncbi:hypothetical protein P4133_21480 [Pseudomonas aeruginosa]|nr:hypothetical protein [Pseudomonas aeruginosa]